MFKGKKAMRRIVLAGVTAAALIVGGVAAADASADEAGAKSNYCNGIGHGKTTAWATCHGSGYQARLWYWCKKSLVGSSWVHEHTGWKTVNGTTKLVGECTFAVDDPVSLEYR
ncbi:MAG TPA: hypothetical protein VE172_24265 [Stackebrandtia sp.]|jgi:hypothetical protein|uniref:hypothetical protein n=1 Tax=Stackebrandtia sp. TaxID=2023065 RepID=UPI002D63443F|nr:hypothetical protein [Stackebrandtia sp.]HZE41926.1 hypothetical protein [Stackebrandtia sp.]